MKTGLMKNLRFFIATIFVILFLAVLASQVFACTCLDPGPPCQAYWNSEVVFSGTPISVSNVEVEFEGHKWSQRLFRFRIEEAFRGVEGQEIEVLTGVGGGDCGYDFQVGTKYLVYGGHVQGKTWVGTSICTRTRPLANAVEDLDFIRNVSKAAAGGEIFGVARRYSINLETGEWNEASGISGAKVTAISGERHVEEVTNNDGSYRFKGLAPGKYTVRVTLPSNLTPQQEQTVEVHDRGCAQIDYRAVVDGRISGRLINAHGRGMETATVDLLPVMPGKGTRAMWAITESDGRFEFKNLPPGRYILGVNIGDPPEEEMPYQTTYYPSTSEQSKAQVIILGEGQRLANIKFQLPPPLKRRAITGVVIRDDGKPVVQGEVSLTEVASDRPAGMNAKVDARGRFSIEAYEGVRYKVRASVPVDPNWDPNSGQPVGLLVSPEVEVTPSLQSKPLRLVIETVGDGIKRSRGGLRTP